MSELETPALIVHAGILEANLARLGAAAASSGLRLRPHAKAHKCPTLARRQVELGAVGVCCQKVSEAEHMVYGGLKDVLITNEIVDPAKLRRVAALARRAAIGLCVDSLQGIALAQQATVGGAPLDVYVEIDVGQGRCGTRPGQEAVALAAAVRRSPGLRLRGLQAFNGAAQHLRHHAERLQAAKAAAKHISLTRTLMRQAKMPCEIVSGGGTGTLELDLALVAYDELQPGSYVFMDADYARNLDDEPGRALFAQSLFVQATVISAPGGRYAVLDAGLKAFSVDCGMPQVAERTDLRVSAVSDEHAKLESSTGKVGLSVGDRVALIPSHIDPTVNLHDYLLVVRNGVLAELWTIAARGAGL